MQNVKAVEKGTVDDLPPNKAEAWYLAASCSIALTIPSYLVGRPCIYFAFPD